MKLKIAQVIGLNTDQKAAQVTSATRDGPSAPLAQKDSTGDTFLAVLGLECDDAFTKGRVVLSELEDFFFEFEGGVPEKLNATFKEAESKSMEGWDLCLSAISGKVLYIIGKGAVEVYLKRADKLSPLLSIGAPSQLISGFLQDKDRLMFAANSLIAFLGSDLEKSFNLPIDAFEEEVGGKIGVSSPVPSGTGLAALLVEVAEPDLEIAPAGEPEELSISAEPNPIWQNAAKKIVSLLQISKNYFPKSHKGRLVLAVILILVIALGSGYKYKLSRDAKTQAEFNRLFKEAKDAFEGAKGLTNLNPADAKSKLDVSKDLINKALSLKPKSSDAGNLKAQIESEEPSILQQSAVSDFPQFLDLDLIKKDFRASQMSLSKGKLLLLDSGTKTLVIVNLAKKSNEILAGSEKLGEATLFSLNGELAFVYSEDKGILKVDSTKSKVTTVAKIDKEWGEIKDIYGFAGNIYLLDSGQVWKYLPTADGYSDKREYLTKNTKADFSNSLRMQIESSIYVLKSGGEILRFTKGDKDNFSYSGLPSGVKDPKSIFTSSDTDNLYVLDSGNSRLLILTKTGSYKGQITGSKFGTATDLVVDEEGKKVYLLEGSKIYLVELAKSNP